MKPCTATSLVIAGAAMLMLGGCATPQAALDQANNGAALTAALQIELRAFRAVQANVGRGRIDSIRRQNLSLATYDADAAFEERVQRVAGREDQLRLYAALTTLADSRAKDEADLQTKMAEYDTAFAKLLAPLPDPGGKLAATQQTLGALGEQLTFQDRLKMAADFATVIKVAIDENRKKITAAQAAAPVAQVQPASTK